MTSEFRGKPVNSWLTEQEPTVLLIECGATTPNNPELPVIWYRQGATLPESEPAELFETLFTSNHWPSVWRGGVFEYHHFHTTAHEALGVYSGNVTVQLGGEQGSELTIEAGDIAVIPAGVAHKNLGCSKDLWIVGAYPEGQSPDRGRPDAGRLDEFLARINDVPLPFADPAFGTQGPLMSHWRE